MNEFHQLARRTVKHTAFATSFFVILWAVLPSNFKPVFAGLSIGSAVSLYFAFSVARQAEIAADVALRQVKKRPGGIFAFRLVMLFAGVMIMQGLEPKIGYVSLPGLLVGIFVYQLVILGGFLYNKIKTS